MGKAIKNLVGLRGGSDATYFEVLAEQDGELVDYPSIKNGKPLHYDDPAYWAHKTPRKRPARILTVAGNAVSCESTIKAMGLGASATGPSTVYVYAADDPIRASERAAELGRHTSPAKAAGSRANGAKGGRPKIETDKAQDVFALDVYEIVNGRAWVGDGQERFYVPAAALEDHVPVYPSGSDAETKAYDKWSIKWGEK